MIGEVILSASCLSLGDNNGKVSFVRFPTGTRKNT